MANQAAKRTLNNLTNVPVMTWNNDQINDHVKKLLELDGA